MTHWLPKSPPHYNVNQWWCNICGKVTLIEKNSEWVADGCPNEFEKTYEWFVRCKECGRKHFQQTGFECPKCGCFPDYNDDAYISLKEGKKEYIDTKGCRLIHMTKPVYNYGSAMEWGGQPLDWIETWVCGACGNEFTTDNSNY